MNNTKFELDIPIENDFFKKIKEAVITDDVIRNEIKREERWKYSLKGEKNNVF